MKFKPDLPQKSNTEILLKVEDDDHSFQTIDEADFIEDLFKCFDSFRDSLESWKDSIKNFSASRAIL